MRVISIRGCLVLLLPVLASACHDEEFNHVGLEIRLATSKRAQNDHRGLSKFVSSLRIEVRQDSMSGVMLDDTGCIEVGSESRETLTVDLVAGQSVVLVVSGWENETCEPGGQPQWKGISNPVDIIEGRETTVPVYLTKRGGYLNPARGDLARPVAFGSAVRLLDGKVLIAGGFDEIQNEQGESVLRASTGLLQLYDPSTATVEVVGVMSDARGGHIALPLPDGKVLIAGGSSVARVLFVDGRYRSMGVDPVYLVRSAEVFDPETGRSTILGTGDVLARFLPAIVLLNENNVLMLGGRANLLRTDELVLFSSDGANWKWEKLERYLAASRNYARAARIPGGMVIVGGNDRQYPNVEFMESSLAESVPVQLGASAGTIGHSLDVFLESMLVWAGGIPDAGGQQPVGNVVIMQPGNGSQPVEVANVFTLDVARAFHASWPIRGSEAMLVAGGIGEDGTLLANLEIVEPAQLRSTLLAGQELQCGSLGIAGAEIADGSIVLAGGLKIAGSLPVISSTVQIFSP